MAVNWSESEIKQDLADKKQLEDRLALLEAVAEAAVTLLKPPALTGKNTPDAD